MDEESRSEKSVLKYWTEAFKNDHLYKDQYEQESSINLVSLQCALDNLKEKDWRKIRQGCQQISIYGKEYPSQIEERKTEVLKAVLHHINSSSVVTRDAVHSLRDIIVNIENFTTTEWEQIFSTFLVYYGIAPSKYMVDLVEESLKYVIDKISYQTSGLILTSTSKKLKHKKSKELAAKLLKKVVVELGPYNILTENNDLGSNILKTAAKLLAFQSDATRYYGKKILYSLMMSQAFEKFLVKHVPPSLRQLTNDAVMDIKKKFKKAIIINNLSRFKVCEISVPFERRITSLAWHPNYPEISVAGSKGGDLLLHSLKVGADDHFIPGVGAGGSILGLKFCNTDPYTVYTASMTGKISRDDFHKQNSKVLLHLPLAWDNWFTCLDTCYNRNFLISGDCTGNSYLLKTSGEKVWKKKKLHTAKISHCEFNMNDPNIFVTSSVDRTVKLWDLRKISENGLPEPLLKFDFDKGVSSATFSPSNRLNLLVTDHHSQLRVYSSPCWNEKIVIAHPHRHFQHMTSIKAIWHPMEDIIVVGRYPDDNIQVGDHRTIDFYDGSTGERIHQIRSPSGNIVYLNAFNSTGDTILSAAGHQVVYMQAENILNEVDYHGSDNESESTMELKLNMLKRRTRSSAKANRNIGCKKSLKSTKSV